MIIPLIDPAFIATTNLNIVVEAESKYPTFSVSTSQQVERPSRLKTPSKLIFFKRVDELTPSSKAIIGELGTERFNKFKQYPDDWDGEGARPLQNTSIVTFETFLNIHGDSFATPPSLFLSKRGNLQLAWESSSGSFIELEFFPTKITYFIETGDDEGSYKLLETSNLVRKLQNA